MFKNTVAEINQFNISLQNFCLLRKSTTDSKNIKTAPKRQSLKSIKRHHHRNLGNKKKIWDDEWSYLQ